MCRGQGCGAEEVRVRVGHRLCCLSLTFIAQHKPAELIEVGECLDADWLGHLEPCEYRLTLAHKLHRPLDWLSCLLVGQGDQMCDRNVLDNRVDVKHAREARADDRFVFQDLNLCNARVRIARARTHTHTGAASAGGRSGGGETAAKKNLSIGVAHLCVKGSSVRDRILGWAEHETRLNLFPIFHTAKLDFDVVTRLTKC